jgi:hypothetical protein
MAVPGIRAVWREIGAFPALRRLGIAEVLEFEHTSADLPDPGVWWAHGILWWAGLDLSMGADPDADLTGVYTSARYCLENDDPASWLARGA